MSHSGNSSSRRIKNLQKLHGGGKGGGAGEQFYNPSVFRYKCYGYLNLNSEDTGSYGTCRGYQSRMERVANMVPDTREGAIKKFLEASNDLGTYVDTDDNSSDQKVKEIYTARTMIYKEDVDDAVNSNNNKIQPVKPSSPLPEDELINKTEWSCWGSTSVHYLVLDPIRKARRMPKQQSQQQIFKKSPGSNNDDAASEAQKEKADALFDALTQQLGNYDKNFDQQFDKSSNNKNNGGDDDADDAGSSSNNESDKENSSGKKQRRNSAREVVEAFATKQKEKLVVAKVGNNNVSAITPENIGVSIRKIDSSVGHFTVTDIGSIRICVETSGSLIGDSSNNQNNNNKNPFDRNKSSQQLANTTSNSSNSSNGGQDHQDNNNGGKSAEGEQQRTPAQELKKFYDFTIKVGHQFQYNCKEIREAIRDDYPMRTYRFGSKVVNRFQKTSEQTFTYMGKILNSWWKSM